MDKLYELIKLISSNSFITLDGGIMIPIDNVSTSLLDKHREDINTLCAQYDLQFSPIAPKVEEVQQAKFDANGEYVGQETVSKFVKKNGFEQKGGYWLSASLDTPEGFAKSLGR